MSFIAVANFAYAQETEIASKKNIQELYAKMVDLWRKDSDSVGLHVDEFLRRARQTKEKETFLKDFHLKELIIL